jgi:hypothetical protein
MVLAAVMTETGLQIRDMDTDIMATMAIMGITATVITTIMVIMETTAITETMVIMVTLVIMVMVMVMRTRPIGISPVTAMVIKITIIPALRDRLIRIIPIMGIRAIRARVAVNLC